jgi:hypothetical protein
MLCRNCGTEIADKAIVCYRCGTGTSEPARKPAEIRPRRSPVVPIAALVILLVLAWYLGRHYHVLGLELPPESAWSLNAVYSLTVLIDFATIHA